MHYIIYIDKVWLMDFVISTYLLFLTGQTYRMQKRLIRLLASAAAGATVFTILLLLPGIGFLPKILIQTVCVNPLLLRAAFSFRTKEMVVKAYACMHGYGLLIGGITACVSGYLPGGQRRLHFWEILFLCTLSAGAVSLYLFLRKKSRKEAGLYAVKMDFYGKKLDVTGFADSGNGLYEPYGRRPVSVLEKKAAESFLERVPPEKHLLVPFHSIGKKHGLLAAVELPGMEVDDGEEKKVFSRVVVALSEEVRADKTGYQVILHPEFVR